jgi:alpha-mannosidase
LYPQYIKVAIDELKKAIIVDSVEIDGWEYRTAVYNGPGDYEFLDDWKPISMGETWGKVDTTAFFRAQVRVPGHLAGKNLCLELLFNGEGVLKVNGEYHHGLDRNRSLIPLADSALENQEYFLEAEVVGQFRPYDFSKEMGNSELEFMFSKARLITIDKESQALLLDLLVGWEVANSLPKEALRAVLETILYRTVTLLDFQDIASHKSVRQAHGFYKEEIAKVNFGKTGGKFHLIGHSHIDVAWLWQLKETVRKCSRSFSTVLALMERYPHYYFTQSQAQLYDYTKKYYPQIYKEIVKRVADGRWEPTGSTWVEMDCNVPSGESLVRQFLYGKKFFMEEFGIETKVLWLPDVFGYTWSLPQIMKKAGVDYFLTNKIRWNDTNRFPYAHFWWEGIDGTRILAHIPPSSSYNGNVTPNQIRTMWDDLEPKDGPGDVIYSYGYGDGGGGVTWEMLEYAKRLQDFPGVPRCQTGKAQDFFEDIESYGSQLPVWNGELYFEYHRGTYTTQGKTKRFNRKSEILYREVELWSSVASHVTSGLYTYPKGAIDHGWKTILLNQFHDILPGSSIGEVYDDAIRDYIEIVDVGERALDSSLKVLASMVDTGVGEGIPVMVFNSLSWERDDVVEVNIGDVSPGRVLVEYGGQMKDVPWQPVEGDEEKIIFLATDVPPMGYRVFWIIPGNARVIHGKPAFIKEDEATGWPILVDGEYVRLELEAGQITRIYDKIGEREVIPPGMAAGYLQSFEDRPVRYDAWDIDPYYVDKPLHTEEILSLQVLENGPVRTILRFEKRLGESSFLQDMVLYRHTPRIDFFTKADWRQRRTLLKVAFPVEVRSSKATYEIAYGAIERATHSNTSWEKAQYEVCGHKWADLSEGDYGVSLLNDCKYGYDIKGNLMRLTLLRSPIYPDPHADQGEHIFVYSLYPHRYDWRYGGTVQEAYSINQPLHYVVKEEGNLGSGLPRILSLVNMDATNVILEVLKEAEDGQGLIIRLFETYGQRGSVHLEFASPIKYAEECDLLERRLADVEYCHANLQFYIKPYEIRTFRIRL